MQYLIQLTLKDYIVESRSMENTIRPFEDEENEQILKRREKLDKLRGAIAFPNDFKPEATARGIRESYSDKDSDFFKEEIIDVKVAGRIMAFRLMGKASFLHIQDRSGKIQIYLRKDDLGFQYEEFKTWDLGDIVAVEGILFKTKTGELSVKASSVRLLVKSLRPLPDKFHGLVDQEQRFRKRYLDLIANEKTRRVFQIRSKMISILRRFFEENDFVEVETPMMQSLPGGAAAKPFVTHHNALDMELYMRIAPELYLKRLVVGGIERVFEINRNFRNEGISTQHNPEFTMLEFYQAYANYHDLMDLTEDIFKVLALELLGETKLIYQGVESDLSKPFARMTVKDSILHFNSNVKSSDLESVVSARNIAEKLSIPLEKNWGLGKIQIEIFEKTVEKKLREPTFITAYPAEVSPLARKNDQDPFITDRFEFFFGGFEIANGFSELNDPEDQAERFRQQAKEYAGGDEEAMRYDE